MSDLKENYLPQLVTVPHNEISYDWRIMEHSEHALEEHNCLHPLSPKVHARRVPCQWRFSFPLDRPADTKLPLDSTFSLQNLNQFWVVTGPIFCRSYLRICIICRKWGLRCNDLVYVPHRWASWLMPPRRFELTSHYDCKSERMGRNLNWKTTTLECGVAGRNFQNCSSFMFGSCTCLVATTRICECGTCLATVIEIFIFWLLVAILELN